MSRANLLVKFPDGSIKAGLYDATGGFVMPLLYDTCDQAWDFYRANRMDAWGTDEQYELHKGIEGDPVEIFTDYGGGFWWHGKAIKTWVTEGGDFSGYAKSPETFDGYPEWATNYWHGEN